MREESRKCSCGGLMTRGVVPQTFVYGGCQITIEQPGWYCKTCREGVHDGADIEATDRAFMAFKAEVDGVLPPDEVHRIRERLGLSQRRASEMLGGGPRAFQKYESGTVAVSLPMSNLLRLLDQDPKRIGELGGAKRPDKRARRKRKTPVSA